MTVDKLKTLSIDALYELASKMGLDLPPELESLFVIEALIEAYEEDSQERKAASNDAVRIEEDKFSGSELDEIDVSLDVSPCIVHRYNETSIHLIARDPEWAFVFWDIWDEDLAILHELGKFSNFFLRVISDTNYEEKALSTFDVSVGDNDTHWYLHLPKANCVYKVDLYAKVGAKVKLLAQSHPIRTPRSLIEDSILPLSDNTAELAALSGLDKLKIIPVHNHHPSRILDGFED